jgi:hypothetical protein
MFLVLKRLELKTKSKSTGIAIRYPVNLTSIWTGVLGIVDVENITVIFMLEEYRRLGKIIKIDLPNILRT